MNRKLFDLAEEYDSQLQKRLDLAAESVEYLDFGCGIGRTARHLSEAFSDAHIVGVDTAKAAIAHAHAHYKSRSREFHPLEELPALGSSTSAT